MQKKIASSREDEIFTGNANACFHETCHCPCFVLHLLFPLPYCKKDKQLKSPVILPVMGNFLCSGLICRLNSVNLFSSPSKAALSPYFLLRLARTVAV